MKALITGASSGIGLEIARVLASKGYDITCASRKERDFSKLKEEFPNRSFDFIPADLSTVEGVKELLDKTKDADYGIFCDNAGFGAFGGFTHSELDMREIEMINLDIIAAQLLLKEFLRRFDKAQKGRVLVTSSAASFGPAPYMAPYYACKAYVYRLAMGYWRELKDKKSKATISILCPGPVATGFEKNGNLKFQFKPTTPERVAKVAVKGLLKGKTVIVPTFLMKAARFFSRFVSDKLITKVDKKAAK